MAPRKLSADITFDDAEDEIFATRALLKADPDAADLLPMTDDWLALVDAARAKDRAARVALADANAARVIANDRLDRECTAFGDELLLGVKKDTKSARWGQFFTVSVSAFVRQRLDKQVNKVRGWLDANVVDSILESHRTQLETWTAAAEQALTQTHGVALVRGTARIAREQMAEDLTRDRDGLFEALAARARERDLPREWPSLFFRVESRRKAADDADPTPADPPAAPGAGSKS